MTAVEHYRAGEITDRQWAHLERQAKLLAKSSLVPKAMRGKPDDVMAVGLTARSLGMELNIVTLKKFAVFDGQVEPLTELYVSLATRAGHEVWPDQDNDDTASTMYGRRKGSDREVAVTFTIEQARQAGLLDEWVERWNQGPSGGNFKETFVLGREGVEIPEWAAEEIAAGKVKRRENWWRYRSDMLNARAAKRVCRLIAGDVMLGIESALGDAETIPPDGAGQASREGMAAGPGTPKRPPGPQAQPFIDVDELAPQSFVTRFPAACEGENMTEPEIAALIAHATGGRTREVGEVRRNEVEKVRATFAALIATPPALRFVDVEEGGDVAVAAA